MVNELLDQIDKLNEINDSIDDMDYEGAKDKINVWKSDLQEKVDQIDSDVDTQLQLEMESKWGK